MPSPYSDQFVLFFQILKRGNQIDIEFAFQQYHYNSVLMLISWFLYLIKWTLKIFEGYDHHITVIFPFFSSCIQI